MQFINVEQASLLSLATGPRAIVILDYQSGSSLGGVSQLIFQILMMHYSKL